MWIGCRVTLLCSWGSPVIITCQTFWSERVQMVGATSHRTSWTLPLFLTRTERLRGKCGCRNHITPFHNVFGRCARICTYWGGGVVHHQLGWGVWPKLGTDDDVEASYIRNKIYIQLHVKRDELDVWRPRSMQSGPVCTSALLSFYTCISFSIEHEWKCLKNVIWLNFVVRWVEKGKRNNIWVKWR